MECKKVIEILEKQSPKSYACDWDNVGLLVGREDKEIQKIYIALDATDEAIEEAIANGADGMEAFIQDKDSKSIIR